MTDTKLDLDQIETDARAVMTRSGIGINGRLAIAAIESLGRKVGR